MSFYVRILPVDTEVWLFNKTVVWLVDENIGADATTTDVGGKPIKQNKQFVL